MLKKAFLAVMGLAVNGLVFAGTMGPVCAPGNVTVPCEASRWDLGVQALYLQSVYSSSKGYYQAAPTGDLTGINNAWDWGYRLAGSYHFNTGNDIKVDWMHFSDNPDRTNLVGSIITFQPPATVRVLANQAFHLIGETRLDQLNLEMGQIANFGLVKKMRFFGGLQYAHIQANATQYYTTLTPFERFDNTDFKGFGPTVGIDYAYDVSNAFSLTAHGAGSVLYGTSRYSNGFVLQPAGLVYSSTYAKAHVMVPTLDAKLGMNYAYNMMQGVLNFEGGYQSTNYFNALQSQGGALSGSLANSDYGLYGPYFGLKYLGNA
jgi:hypothetical protein